MNFRFAQPPAPSAILLGLALMLSSLTDLRVTSLISFCDLFFLAAVVVGLGEKFLGRTRIHFPVAYLLAGFLLFVSYAAHFNLNAPAHDAYFFILVINFVLIPMAILFVSIRSSDDLKFLLILWSAGAVFGAAYTVAYCHGFVSGHYDWFWEKLRRARGLTPHPNIMAMGSVMAYPGLLLLFFESRRWLPKILAGLAMLVCWYAVSLSGSRSGVVCLFVLVGVFMLLYMRVARAQERGIISAIALLVISGLIVDIAILGFQPDHQSALWRLFFGGESSSYGRSLYRETALQAFFDSPLIGHGYHWFRYSHNSFLEGLHSGGIIGFFGYFITLVFPVLALYFAPIRNRQQYLPAIAVLAAICALLVSAWVRASLTDLSTSVVFALGVLVAASLRQMNQRQSQAELFEVKTKVGVHGGEVNAQS